MKGQTNTSILHARLQRNLRKAPTNAEHVLWRNLQRRQLEGCKFRRQHAYGNHILDFVCLERGVVIEIDGSQHADAADYDAVRTCFLNETGFVVLRFWNNDVLGDIEGVREAIGQCLVSRATPSPPNPPLEGERLR